MLLGAKYSTETTFDVNAAGRVTGCLRLWSTACRVKFAADLAHRPWDFLYRRCTHVRRSITDSHAWRLPPSACVSRYSANSSSVAYTWVLRFTIIISGIIPVCFRIEIEAFHGIQYTHYNLCYNPCMFYYRNWSVPWNTIYALQCLV